MFNMGQFFHEARPFNTQLKCFSPAMTDRRDVERGGKIILPPSALEWLTRLNIVYPMLFKLTNPDPKIQRTTHCGVLEFVADEGKCHIPYWMMKNILLEEGQVVQVESVSLPVATYAKFKPQNVEFLNISNPRAVLELHLRNFACLTKGDVVAIEYNNKIYEMLVNDLKPGNAVTIIECDLNVEFDAPEGYVEPTPETKPKNSGTGDEEPMDLSKLPHPEDSKFKPFSGEGQRVDGRTKKFSQSEAGPSLGAERSRGVPNYDYKPGKLTFIRSVRPLADANQCEQNNFEAFSGKGRALKDKKKGVKK